MGIKAALDRSNNYHHHNTISHHVKVFQEGSASTSAYTTPRRPHGGGEGAEGSHDTDDLLDYVGYLENELDRLKSECDAATERAERHKKEKRQVKERLDDALDKLDKKQESLKSARLLQEEHIREHKALEEKIGKLEAELEAKKESIKQRRRREEKAMKQLEKENEMLKKKCTLGWMLGCLSEVYLQSGGPEGRAADPLLKMVRDIQRELERENVVLSYSNEPPHIQLEYVEKEIRRLIDCARLAQSEETSTSTAGSFNRSGTMDLHIEETSHRRRRRRGDASNRSDRSYEKANTRTHEEEEGPNARFIINCFNSGGPEAVDAAPKSGESIGSRSSQIEVFEANPSADVEHTRVSGSTWAEVKVMKMQEAERAELLHCQSDIKKMLCNLQASLNEYANIAASGVSANSNRTRSLTSFLRPSSPLPKRNRSSSLPKPGTSCSRAPICPKPKSIRFK